MESKELLPELESIAHKNGFQLFGAAKAIVPDVDKRNILEWVQDGRHGKMDWFPRNMKLRLELEGLGFQAETVFVLGALYSDPDYEEITSKLPFRFSRYATGTDYHTVLKKSARDVMDILRNRFPNNVFRQGVDSLPVPEKILAREAGLGWIGKNTNLLNEQIGSYFFLTVIFTDLPLRIASLSAKDRCGTCDECIRACPTGALAPYQIDARKCISYKTIEDRSPTVEGLHGWVYGCDICQEVCPWNRVKAKRRGAATEIEEFRVRDFFRSPGPIILALTEEEFQRQFSDAAVNRISYAQFRRNLISASSE